MIEVMSLLLLNIDRGVRKYHGEMVKLNRRLGWFRNFIIIYSSCQTLYFSSGAKPQGINIDLYSKMLYFDQLIFVYNVTVSYLLVGWCVQLHIYCFCIKAALCEINHFIKDAIQVKCASEKEAIAFFTSSISRNARLALSVRYLDDIFKRFAFFQLGMIIPSILFVTFAAIMRRNSPLIEFLPNAILVIVCLSLFHVLTIFPARLHNQVKKTRTLFCSNIRQWIHHGRRVHTAALVFSSHLGQTDVGLTLWGFALLSKPLILTIAVSLSNALAIFLQFSDCKKQIERPQTFHNTSTSE
ncbi:hypothetical protein PFISCL1PPCAC_14300, partial [Pristionchus fissidentatus]